MFLLNRDTDYIEHKPADILEKILKADIEINEKTLGWLKDILRYQKQSTAHTEEFIKKIKNGI